MGSEGGDGQRGVDAWKQMESSRINCGVIVSYNLQCARLGQCAGGSYIIRGKEL